MALKDLIITNQKISEDLIENVLRGKVDLVQDGNKIILTREGSRFSNKIKVLLFLAGGKAWELLDNVNLSFSPGEMESVLSIPGNSLRPILKGIADNFLASSNKGKYQITPKGIYELETMLESAVENRDAAGGKSSKANRVVKSPKSSNIPLKSKAIEELISEGYFSLSKDSSEILIELGRRGVMIKPTSLPSYLLPLIRKKVLVRDHKEKNKRKVWTYMKAKAR